MPTSEVSPKDMPSVKGESKPLLLGGSAKSLRRLYIDNKLDAFKDKLRTPSGRDQDFFDVLNLVLEDVNLSRPDFLNALVQVVEVSGDLPDPGRDNRTPLILAAFYGNLPAMHLLLPVDTPACSARLLEARDAFGWTPLHAAVNATYNAANAVANGHANAAGNASDSADRMECVAFLLKRHHDLKVNVGTQEQRGRSAFYLAARHGTCELIQEFLKYEQIGLDVVGPKDKDSAACTPRELIQRRFPTLGADVAGKPLDDALSLGDELLRLLNRGDDDSQAEFCAKVAATDADDRALRHSGGTKTLMQTACFLGRRDAVDALLAKAPALAATPSEAAGTDADVAVVAPLFLAAERGFGDVLEVFRNRAPKQFKERTPDHDTVLIALVRHWNEGNERDRYYACLARLLSANYKHLVDVNATNKCGDSALHLAVICRHTRVSAALLDAGAWLGGANARKRTPLDHLPAEALKMHLDACVTSKGDVDEENREIIFNYLCLRAPSPPPLALQASGKMASASDAEAQHACANDAPRREMDVLYGVSRSKNKEMRRLLMHPVLNSFLDHKWEQIQFIYYINVVFYSLFVVFITWHILEIGGNPTTATPAVLALAVVGYVYLGVRECAQALIDPCRYVHDAENWLEVALIACAGLVLVHRGPHARFFAAAAILLVWCELMLLLGRHPRCAVYVEMLKTVAWNFFKFLGWFVSLIIAFSLCFFTLFRADALSPAATNGTTTASGGAFGNFWTSAFKTLVMMAGELNVNDVPLGDLPVLSHSVFLMFLFLVVIVLLNLLNGLAVSDTQAIKDDAELVCCASRVEMAASLESALFDWLRHCPYIAPPLTCILLKTTVFRTADAVTEARILPNGDRILRVGPRKEVATPHDRCCLRGLPGRVGVDTCCRVNRKVVRRAEQVLATKEARSELHELAREVEKFAKEVEERLARRVEEMGQDVTSAVRAALAERTAQL